MGEAFLPVALHFFQGFWWMQAGQQQPPGPAGLTGRIVVWSDYIGTARALSISLHFIVQMLCQNGPNAPYGPGTQI